MSDTPFLFTPNGENRDEESNGDSSNVVPSEHSSLGFYSTHLSYPPNRLYILSREGLDTNIQYDDPNFYGVLEELARRMNGLINRLLELRPSDEYSMIEQAERGSAADIPDSAALLISSRSPWFNTENITDDDIYNYFRDECGITNFEMWELYTMLWWGWISGNFRRHIDVDTARQIVGLTTEEAYFVISVVVPEDYKQSIMGNYHYAYSYILITGYIPDDVVPTPVTLNGDGSAAAMSPETQLLTRLLYEDLNLVVQLYYCNFFNDFYDITFGLGTRIEPGVPFYKALLKVVTRELLDLYFNLNEQNLEEYLQIAGVAEDAYQDRMNVNIPVEVWRQRLGSYANYVKAKYHNLARPSLDLFTIDSKTIELYSDNELLWFYGYRVFILPETRSGPTRWGYLHAITVGVAFWQPWSGECDNDHINSIMTLEPRSMSDKNDTDDINIALERLGRRRCFQASELEASFRNLSGFFIFYDPDYDYETPMIDPITGFNVNRALSLPAVLNLHEFLINEEPTPTIEALIKKIDFGVKKYKETSKFLLRFKDAVYRSSAIAQNFIVTYITSIFLLSMWARFWKGPGYQYPVIWDESMSRDLCPALQRDKHIDIEFNVYGQLMSDMERFMIPLVTFVKQLPLIHYSWTQGFYVKADEEFIRNELGAYYMGEAIDGAQHGMFCLAQFGDILAQSSYVYMRVGLGYSDQRINEVLVETSRKLRVFENIAINAEEVNVTRGIESLGSMNPESMVNTPEGPITFNEYRNRLIQAQQAINDHRAVVNNDDPNVVQPPLSFSSIQDTMHIQM